MLLGFGNYRQEVAGEKENCNALKTLNKQKTVGQRSKACISNKRKIG
jgi:hypothetical protein